MEVPARGVRRLAAVAVVVLLGVAATACDLDGGTVDAGRDHAGKHVGAAAKATTKAQGNKPVVHKTVRKRERIPQPTRTREVRSLRAGTTKVARPGRPGTRLRVYRLTMQGRVVLKRKVVRSSVLRKPVARLVLIGTSMQPNVPANAPCDRNYSGRCVPFASDVDCLGGGGDGPGYVRGPVKVVGIDVYDLDPDGDGIGCN
jgi:hypothetical protein